MADWFDNVPVPMDANGCVVPLDTKELVYRGETREVYGFTYSIRLRIWFVEFGEFGDIHLGACTMPDSWERLEEGLKKDAQAHDVIRRAKALSGLREGRKGVPKAMVSQPMAGETDGQIVATRERATAKLEAMGYEVVDTLLTEEAVDGRGVAHVALRFLAKSLESMGTCRAVCFCKGWEKARGCRIEHDAAVAYGLEVLYED